MDRFFVSIEKLVQKAPTIWKQNTSMGELVIVKFDKKKQFTILRLKDFVSNPIYNKYLEGYLETMVKLAQPTKTVTCTQIKNTHKGANYNEYKISWK